MSVMRLVGDRSAVAGLLEERVASASAGVDVRMDIHDASRLEWSVSLPLPERMACRYTIGVEMDIPSNAFARHTPWDQMQSFTRLDGGEAFNFDEHIVTIDALRRNAVAIANQMGKVGEGFTRHCVVATSLFTPLARRDLHEALIGALDSAKGLVHDARTKLATPHDDDPVELARERVLVDEYVSLRWLTLLAGAGRAVTILQESRAPQASELVATAHTLESHIADALQTELTYREACRYACANPGSQPSLEAYLERSSRLKKHFQEVLFLEAEVYQVAERLHHWAAGLGAVVASFWALILQMALSKHATTSTSTVGSELVTFAIVAGVIYATKDRVKEIGRTWIHGNVHRFYAQRVARYRAPARRLATRDVVVTARESFEQRVIRKPDPLNPESGYLVPSTMLRYTHRGRVLPTPGLTVAGVKRVKHVFRYDLSPLFARLDDAVKQVPVLDACTHKVRFTEAPRSYRFPFRIRVTCNGRTIEEAATVVLHKGGLDRLERVTEGLGE